MCRNIPGDAKLRVHPPVGRPAIHGIFKSLMEEVGVFTVQVNGTLVMGQWLAFGSTGGCQEVRKPVNSH